MKDGYVSSISVQDHSLWERIRIKRSLLSFDIEITARCNYNCRHCYINKPQDDKKSREKELSSDEIKAIIDETVSMGALWCLITGGEPLLRDDFLDIYLYMRKKGLLVSVFTNASLVRKEHLEVFRKFPPRDIEVTVYGTAEDIYEGITRKKGSFGNFVNGINLLLKNKIKIRFKATMTRSNIRDFKQISLFCRERSKDFYRFDPFLHLRYDGNPKRNNEIRRERLSPRDIISLEEQDLRRLEVLRKECVNVYRRESHHNRCNHLFHCGIGETSFSVSDQGVLRPCQSLWHPDCVYDLRKGTIIDAWNNLIPNIRDMKSYAPDFAKKCYACQLQNLCFWCPAHAYLETGQLDQPVDFFCETAQLRLNSFK